MERMIMEGMIIEEIIISGMIINGMIIDGIIIEGLIIEVLRSKNLSACESRRKHVAWGGARLCERNPRIFRRQRREPVKTGGSAVARLRGLTILTEPDPRFREQARSTLG